MRLTYSHRAGLSRGQSGSAGEERCFLQEQCTSPLALHHPRPQGPRGQEVLWKVLCWSYRSYQWVHAIHASTADMLYNQSACKKWFNVFVSFVVFRFSFPSLCCAVGIRQLQLMLLKMSLLLGIEIHVNVEFKGLIEPPEDQETESEWDELLRDKLMKNEWNTEHVFRERVICQRL